MKQHMTKADLIAQVAKRAGLTSKAAKDAVSAVFDTVSEASKYINLSQGQLSRILRGIYKNNTNLVLCQDV